MNDRVTPCWIIDSKGSPCSSRVPLLWPHSQPRSAALNSPLYVVCVWLSGRGSWQITPCPPVCLTASFIESLSNSKAPGYLNPTPTHSHKFSFAPHFPRKWAAQREVDLLERQRHMKKVERNTENKRTEKKGKYRKRWLIPVRTPQLSDYEVGYSKTYSKYV